MLCKTNILVSNRPTPYLSILPHELEKLDVTKTKTAFQMRFLVFIMAMQLCKCIIQYLWAGVHAFLKFYNIFCLQQRCTYHNAVIRSINSPLSPHSVLKKLISRNN